MKWDITVANKYLADGRFKSIPLTITGLEWISIIFSRNTQKGLLVTVAQDIDYWKNPSNYGEGKVTKKTFMTLSSTYENNEKPSLRNNSAFYYFVYHFKNKSDVEIPFVGYWFSADNGKLADWVFCLSEEANKIVEDEKKRWDDVGLTKEEDLKIENVELVDAKWDALKKDINDNDWNPSLKEEERKLIVEAKTKKEVQGAQKRIASLRGQKGQNNKIEGLKDQIKDLEEKNGKLKSQAAIDQADIVKLKNDKEKLINQPISQKELAEIEKSIADIIFLAQKINKDIQPNEVNWKQTLKEGEKTLTEVHGFQATIREELETKARVALRQKIGNEISDWKESELSQLSFDYQEEINKRALRELVEFQETALAEINRLKELFNKRKAAIGDIEEEIKNGKTLAGESFPLKADDLLEEFQGFASQINQSTDIVEIDGFAKRVIDSVKNQRLAEIKLKNLLERPVYGLKATDLQSILDDLRSFGQENSSPEEKWVFDGRLTTVRRRINHLTALQSGIIGKAEIVIPPKQ